MARANSAAVLLQQKARAGDDYRSQVVYVSRLFELGPQNKNVAKTLLTLIPKDDAQDTILNTLGDSLCDHEPIADMDTLDRAGSRLPHDFARAVLLVRDAMPAYVAYSQTAAGDPHNDSLVQMQAVCRKAHSEFMRAIETLSPHDKMWFTTRMFDTKNCRALLLPEAE